MKIIETNTAPNPRRVRIYLAEKKIDVEIENIDLTGTKSQEFTALNPMQRVPILLLDDGTIISETIAICRYLEVLNPEPSLFGRTAKEIAMIEMWQRRVELGLFFHVAQVVRHLNPKMAPFEMPQVVDWGEANRPKAMSELEILDTQLGKARYVAGDTYSVADITALVAIDFMRPARLNRPDTLTNLARWYEDVTSRPSTQA
ncbi:MAG: glutathione S-transferase family protein [Hyphomicrobiaceae bacterium]